MKKSVAAMAMLTLVSGAPAIVHAQSSVTLYGAVDEGIGWQSSAGTLGAPGNGHSTIGMINGVRGADEFGMKGVEDLGGGTSAIFRLEQGYIGGTGAMSGAGLAFKRASWVGLTNRDYGTVTFGRGFPGYLIMLSSWSSTKWLTGFFGAHPGDIDALDSSYVNNQIVYTTPDMHGVMLSGSYAFGGAPGSMNAGSTWTLSGRYVQGPAAIALGFARINNSASGGGPSGAYTTQALSATALTYGYQYAQAQQRWVLTSGWQFSPSFDVSFSASNVQLIPGINSEFVTEAVFNTAGLVLHWKPTPAIDIAGGYSYTHASKGNGTQGASYNQGVLSEYYALSKSVGVYALQGWERANGTTLGLGGSIIAAQPTIGDGYIPAPGSARSVVEIGAGVIYHF